MNNPIHEVTPETVLSGRWIIIDDRADGWHIGLLDNDVYSLLRVIHYGSRRLAHSHAEVFGRIYDACVEGMR